MEYGIREKMRAIAFYLLTIIACINSKLFRCDYKYIPSAGGWIKYHRVPANWNEARLRCHLEGANLASPLNQDLKAALQSFLTQDDCGVFTGIHATFSRGDFFSVEGVPLWKIPQQWEMNEPNNFNNEENCLLMTPDGKLADVSCAETYPYFCYKKLSNTMILNECGTIDHEYRLDARTGSCYKFHTEARTWSRAYMTCAAEGGHLAIINSDTEARVINDIFRKNPEEKILGNFYKKVAFIGYHDWNEHGEWVTIEGQTLEEAGYVKWEKGEPNNKTSSSSTAAGQFCGGVTRNGLLDDLFCSGDYEDKFNFICEKRPDSLLCGDNQ